MRVSVVTLPILVLLALLAGLAACQRQPAPTPVAVPEPLPGEPLPLPLPGASTPVQALPLPPAATPAALPVAATPTVPAGSAGPVPAGARTWQYRGTTVGEEGQPMPRALDLVELGRRTVAGRQVLDLALASGGRLLAANDLDDVGLAVAPFAELAPQLTLVFGLAQGKPAVWLLQGDAAANAAAIAAAVREAPTFRLTPDLPDRAGLAEPPADEDYAFRRKVAKWSAVCQGHDHPSPETGDSFASERCYAPGVGLVRLQFESVWGGHELELVAPPTQPDLP